MPVSGVPLRPLIAATAAYSAPALIVLSAFAVYEAISIWHGAAIWAVLTATTFLVLRRQHAALVAMRRYVERSADRWSQAAETERPAGFGDQVLSDLAAAVDRLVRQTRAETSRATTLIQAREMVIDAVAEPLLVLARGGHVSGTNRAAHRLLGISVVGRDLSEVLRHPQVLEAANEVMTGGPPASVEVTLALPTERVFAVRIDPLPAIAADGAAAVLMLSDLTGLKRAERMRADFIANVSHELRTPLASIVGFIETLLGPARDDTAARGRFLEIMNQQAQRMARLVADLLSLSRIEQNEHLPPTGRIDLGQILGTVKATLDVVAQNKAMTIVLDVAPDLPPVPGEADELQQVFQNLVDNAIKYGRTGTSVTITARLAQEWHPSMPRTQGASTGKSQPRALSVAVADRGAGIARQHLPRLTERFYRIDVARSREAGGTGLGLAIVKHILNRHRGALAIDSAEGQGSTFTVYLPEYPG